MRKTLAFGTLLTLLLALTIPAIGQVAENTCNDIGYTNLTSSTSGVWGSITFSDTETTLTLEVAEGYEVMLCVKAGSINQGDGPEESGPYTEGIHVVAHTSLKELSHFGFTFDELPTTTVETTPTTPTTTTTTTAPPIPSQFAIEGYCIIDQFGVARALFDASFLIGTGTWIVNGVLLTSGNTFGQAAQFGLNTWTVIPDGGEPTSGTFTINPCGLVTTPTTVGVNPICIDCNNATQADLMQLRGVNATLADAIIANRPYERLQDLVTKGVMTGAQVLLILVANADTGAFASDLCLQLAVPSTTTTSVVSIPGNPTTSIVFGPAPTTPGLRNTLPFTGIWDYLVPIAIGLVLLGGLVLLTTRRGRID